MSTDPTFPSPHAPAPGTHILKGRRVYPSVATVLLHGVSVDVVYRTEGTYMPATETDEACLPMAVVITCEIGGHDVTRLLMDAYEGELVEAIEAQWEA